MEKKNLAAVVIICAALLFAGCAPAGGQPESTPQPTPPAGVTETPLKLNEGTEWELDARLTMPADAKGPVPAVVLVHGSGPSDMNETVGACAPFCDLAYGLAKRGVAVLRFDKRTFTYGSRIAKDLESFTAREESVDDAIAAAAYLRNDPQIDATRIVGIGHSLGATLVPRIDAAGADFFAMVLLAGTPRPLWEVIYDQNMAVLDRVPADNRASTKKTIEDELQKARRLAAMTDAEAKETAVFGMPGYYFKDLDKHMPQDILIETEKPVLILQGTDDFQVSPEKDFGLFKTVLGDRPDTTFKLYDGLNHLFIESTGPNRGTVNEYATPGHVSEEVLDDVAKWILSL
jgi:dienelactone hydrolase